MAVAQFPRSLDEFPAGGNYPAFPEYGFHDDGTSLIRYSFGQRRQIIVWHMSDTARQRFEPLGIFRLPPHRYGKQGAAMEGLGKGDDFPLLRSEVVAGIFTCQLERRFVGFRTRVGEEDFFREREFAQFPG